MLLQQAMDEFLLYIEIEKNYSDHTVANYAFDLKKFEHFLKQHDRSLELNEINKTIVRRFIQEKVTKEHLKPRTINREISCLKSFAKFCTQENLLDHDFMVGIVAPKVDEKLPVYMTLQEVRKLFKFLEKS